MGAQSRPLANNNAAARSIRKKRFSNNNDFAKTWNIQQKQQQQQQRQQQRFKLCGQAHTNRTWGYYFLGATLIRSGFAVI